MSALASVQGEQATVAVGALSQPHIAAATPVRHTVRSEDAAALGLAGQPRFYLQVLRTRVIAARSGVVTHRW